ncbi:hypothetical protein FRB96_008768 [Tulasnella sp. 330]|nr:hypothetical protein FRB96_008768 [Tulasnella sp. 330]KAG8884124.1 hypothetical protein FRB97_005107 [Tulasnella sp. 331]KAG8890202.1 hypothetical protein FRB98_000530 [Tulasnella sp. 332]
MADVEKRAAALAALREKKKASSVLTSNGTNGSSSGAFGKDRVTSRHFPSSGASGSSPAKILVHDSSPSGRSPYPVATSSKYKPHQGHGVPLLKPTAPTIKPWNRREDDHLASSGFVTSSHPSSSSTSSVSSAGRPPAAQPRRKISVNDGGDERPRKRVNTGAPVETIVLASSPPTASSSKVTTPARLAPPQTISFDDSSPGIVRIRRKLGGAKLASSLPASDDDDDDDDESLPDLDAASKPKRRLVRGRQAESDDDPSIPITIPSSPTGPVDNKDAVSRMHKLFPTVPPSYIAEVISQTGSVEKASMRLTEEIAQTKTLQQAKNLAHQSTASSSSSSKLGLTMPVPNARPPKPLSKMIIPPSPLSPAPQASQFTGRANHKSAIYANRRNVRSSTSSFQQTAQPLAASKSRESFVPAKDVGKASKGRAAKSDGEDAMDMDSDSSGGGGRGKGKKKSEWDDLSSEEEDEDEVQRLKLQAEGVSFFNDATSEQLIEVTACTPAQAASILSIRPFDDHDELRAKFQKKKGISYKLFELYLSVMDGYTSLDKLLVKCESIGASLAHVVNKWAGVDATPLPSKPVTREPSVLDADGEPSSSKPLTVEDTGIHLTQVQAIDEHDPDLKDYIRSQPALISPSVQLKDYQMLGINWLNLLWSRENSAILADEMGLGKTIQVIAFLSHLKETYPNKSYRHLIIVPPSTLENWVREFQRFAPEIDVRTYYGSQNDRVELRYELASSDEWDVVLTTYNFAAGNEHDRKFFKKTEWEVCVFDEGHMLKNFQSQRYEALMRIRANWRLLLTGTPLQNNLQELVSLLNFIMPKLFIKHEESLRAIFKTRADSSLSFLSRERVSRAKKMMTPFVLRRRKDQVLKDLPQKTERIEYCYMTPLQRTIYREALKRSRKTIQTLGEDGQPLDAAAEPAKPKRTQKSKTGKVMTGDTSSNVLMDLRKAASHPMLFRRHFPLDKIRQMAKSCLKEPEFCESNYQYVIEDMEVMTDAELQFFCKRYKSVNKFALDDQCYLDAGKISVLLKLLEGYKAEDKRVLVFSQFTQVLDIIKAIFAHKGIKYLVLTGTTAVDERQGLVDEFNEDETIPVFLLSTKAGGMGINLTAACVVIIFDQDFNPHNDKQAMDRCYRIGQKRDVEVIKLLTKDTIEEDIHRIGRTKLELDDAVAGGQGDDGEKAEKIMKSSLLTALRTKLEKEEEGCDAENATNDDDIKIVGGPSTSASTSEGSATIPIIIDDENSGSSSTHKPQKTSGAVEVF